MVRNPLTNEDILFTNKNPYFKGVIGEKIIYPVFTSHSALESNQSFFEYENSAWLMLQSYENPIYTIFQKSFFYRDENGIIQVETNTAKFTETGFSFYQNKERLFYHMTNNFYFLQSYPIPIKPTEVKHEISQYIQQLLNKL